MFCLVASGTYLVNDVIDADVRPAPPGEAPTARWPAAAPALDRARRRGEPHRARARRRRRCSARGAWRSWSGAYAALNVAYSLRLKQEPVVELAVVASAFVLRAVAGGVVADVRLSNWFLVFTSFAALFVVTGKRTAEYARASAHDRGAHRAVLDEYSESFLKSTLTISATVSVAVVLPLGLRPDRLAGARRAQAVWIELTVIPLVLAVLHILRLVDAGKGGEPEQLALRDHVLQGYALSWLALMGIGLYT